MDKANHPFQFLNAIKIQKMLKRQKFLYLSTKLAENKRKLRLGVII